MADNGTNSREDDSASSNAAIEGEEDDSLSEEEFKAVTAEQVEKHLETLKLSDHQRAAAKDVALSLNSWLHPISKDEDQHDPAWLAGTRTRAAQAEAERLAAAAEAAEFFRACKEKRAYEHTLGGIVHREDVVAARCKPWNLAVSNSLQQTGLSAEVAEKAVRWYAPARISEDVDER